VGRIELAASRHLLTKSNLAKRLQRMWVAVLIGLGEALSATIGHFANMSAIRS